VRLSPWRAGGGPTSADEIRERDVEGAGDPEQVVDDSGLVTHLDPVDRLPVQAGEFGELLLGQLLCGPRLADAVS